MKHVARQHISSWDWFSWSHYGRCKWLNLLHREFWKEKFWSAAGGQDFLEEKLNIRGIISLCCGWGSCIYPCSIVHVVRFLLSKKLSFYYLRYLSPHSGFSSNEYFGRQRENRRERQRYHGSLTAHSAVFFFCGLTLLFPSHSGQFGY